MLTHGLEMLQGFAATPPPAYDSASGTLHGFALPPHIMPLHLGLQSMYWQNILCAMNAGCYAQPGEEGRFGTEDSTTLFALMRRMAEDPELAASIRAEIQQRLQAQMQHMQAYYQARYERTLQEPACIWQQGNCRLLCYSQEPLPQRPAILLIPSLINRYHILDLTQATSFARYLAGHSYPVYVVDWGMPGEAEKHFDCEDYVTRYLCAIGEEMRRLDHPTTLAAGHCMGGMLALALATIRPELVDGLALLATPWDFSKDPLHPSLQGETGKVMLERYVESFELFPGEHILAMFYLRDPWLFQEKLEHFHELEPGSEAYERFLAIEQWVNGCVPLTKGVARDGFVHWATHNQPYLSQWRVGGRLVNPAAITQPTCIATPLKDRIVPHASALALAQAMPHALHLEPDTGHVGMIVGSHAQEQMWEPFVRWANALTL